MTNPKILFDDIADLGDFVIPLDFKFGQFSRGRVFAHDSIGDFIVCQKLSIWCTRVSFIGIHLINRLFRMSAVNRTIRQIVGIVYRSRRHSGGQDKSIVDINRSMLFKPIVRRIIFNGPVWFQIPAELFGACPVTNFIRCITYTCWSVSLMEIFIRDQH